MKVKKIFRNITIILSIAIVILNIVLFVNTKQAYDELKLFSTVFNFATFIWGFILLPIVWIQYFLILAIMKVYNKYLGFKKWMFTSLLTIIEIGLTVMQIRIVGGIFLFTSIFN